MALSNAKPNRMTRLESKKSHSWWWDSHISPINSKWLQENLEEMDQRVKQMLKLIEEDGDSFAKKAEMYYQKRPELIRLVEDFYRRYRSLAERYDNVTGELRKTIPSDLQSQGSGMSDLGWELPSTMPSPDLRPSRRKSGHRAPGFDYFLGGNGSDVYNKEGDESSAFDSGSESDEYFNKSEEHGLRRKVIELEVELHDVKEKLLMRDEESFKSYGEDGPGKMGRYEEEIKSLKMELQKYKSLGDTDDVLSGGVVNPDDPVVLDSEGDVLDSMHKIQRLEEELRITRDKLRETEDEVASLREELTRKGSSMRHLQEELFNWKIKLEKEQGEVSKLQAGDEDQEIRACSNKILSEGNEQLQGEMTRLAKQKSLKELDVHCQGVEEELRRAKDQKAETEAMLGSQIKQLKAELAYTNECMEELKKNLDALQVRYDEVVLERDKLNENISELARDASFKDDQIDQMSNHLHQLHTEHVDMIAGVEGAHRLAEELRSRIKELEREVEKKQEIIVQGAEEKREAIRQLCFSLEHYRNGYHKLREVVNGQKSVEAT